MKCKFASKQMLKFGALLTTHALGSRHIVHSSKNLSNTKNTTTANFAPVVWSFLATVTWPRDSQLKLAWIKSLCATAFIVNLERDFNCVDLLARVKIAVRPQRKAIFENLLLN